MTRSDGLRERVRERYAEAATTVLEGVWIGLLLRLRVRHGCQEWFGVMLRPNGARGRRDIRRRALQPR